jgi:hypothetical protein
MRVKKFNKFTLLLLQYIEQGLPIHSGSKKVDCITKKLGRSKQSLNYHIQKFVKLGLLRHVQSYPYAIYELTSYGVQVKKIIGQSEGIKNLWRVHNLIVGFNIRTFGTFRFIDTKKRKIIQMRNWKYAHEKHGDFVINIQDTGLLKVYCPERYTTNPEEEFGSMYAECQAVAQRYCDRYNMKLEPLRVIRKGHKALLGSQKIAKLLGKLKIRGMWTDESNGTGELEEHQGEYSIEDLIDLPKRMDKVEQSVERVAEVNEKLAKNIELHLEVMNNINKAIVKLADKLS